MDDGSNQRLAPGESRMSANRIFLVCTHHPEEQHALVLGSRLANGYHRAPRPVQIEEWFDLHKHCGGNADHFTIAFQKPKNWDISPPAPPIAAHVRLALVPKDSMEAVPPAELE